MDSDLQFDTVYSYTRAQALEDGVLIDASPLASEAGYRWPVALTSSLFHGYVTPSPALIDEGQSATGRLWDLLMVLRYAVLKAKDTSQVAFQVLFLMQPDAEPQHVDLVAACGPGDDGSPVLTVMLPDED